MLSPYLHGQKAQEVWGMNIYFRPFVAGYATGSSLIPQAVDFTSSRKVFLLHSPSNCILISGIFFLPELLLRRNKCLQNQIQLNPEKGYLGHSKWQHIGVATGVSSVTHSDPRGLHSGAISTESGKKTNMFFPGWKHSFDLKVWMWAAGKNDLLMSGAPRCRLCSQSVWVLTHRSSLDLWMYKTEV